MGTEYPYTDDPEKFSEWLFDRVQIPNIVWDREELFPVHTSYDDWNIWGTLHQSTPRSSPPSPSPTHSNDSGPLRRPTLPRLPSRDSDSSQTEQLQRRIICRISRHELRLQRQYQLLKVLARLDPNGTFHIRSLQLLRLPAREGHDEAPLAAIIYEDAGCLNALRSLMNYGPSWYTINQLPSVHPYNPKISSNDEFETGKISVPTFLKFAKGATRCCAFLHDHRMIHGELRPDAFHFNNSSGQVRFINHGYGYRAFENGLSSASWRDISHSFGITFRLQFVAPEQTGRLPASADNRTDTYSLGILFYLMLTGEVPFEGDSALEVLQNLLGRRVPLISSKRIDIPEAISSVVAKMTQRNIEDRYHSSHGLLADLEQIDNLYDQCLVDQTVSLPDDWVAGAQDARCIFRLPNVQVGRDREQDVILGVISQVHKKRKQIFVAAPSCQDAPTQLGMQSMSGHSLNLTTSTTETGSEKGSIRSGSTTSAGNLDVLMDGLPDDNSSGNYASGHRDSVEGASSMTGPRSPIPNHHHPNDTALSSLSMRAKEKFKRGSKTELIVIYGAVGMGKSRLIQSVLPEARKRGCLSVARFDNTSNTPFQPLIHLLSSLVRQIFMDTSNIDFHASFVKFVRPSWDVISPFLSLPVDLLDLGVNGSPKDEKSRDDDEPQRRLSVADGATIDEKVRMSPPSHSHIGRCTKATKFLRTASKSSRFQAMFVTILRFIARAKTITFVLEDLDSADSESLELLKSIVQSKTLLTIIFTCREKSDFTSEAVGSLLLSKTANVTSIYLHALEEDDVAKIVSQTLHRSTEYCFPLTAVALEKTGGNPFYLKSFLEDCHRKNCIWWSWTDNKWRFNLDEIFATFSAADVQIRAEIILERLQELPIPARQFLAFAAFLGNRFRFSVVKLLMQDKDRPTDVVKMARSGNAAPELPRASSQDAVRGLESLLSASILMSSEDDDMFEFCHTRYQLAAVKLDEASRRDHMSFQISRVLMMDRYKDDDIHAKASHITVASKFIRARIAHRQPYRRVLLDAAATLTEATSKRSSLQYLSNALTLLQDDPWDLSQPDVSYAETLEIYTQAAEAYSSQEYASYSITLLQKIIANARSVFDKVPAYILLSRIKVSGGKILEAFAILRTALSGLGCDIPENSTEQCDRQFEKMANELDALDCSEFENRPLTDDDTLLAVTEILAESLTSAWYIDISTYYQITLKFLDITLHEGITTQAGLALSSFATISIARFGRLKLGVQLGKCADSFFERFDDDNFASGRGLGLNAMQTTWYHQHVFTLIPILDKATEKSLAANDHNTAILNSAFGALTRIWSSYDAVDVESFIQYSKELVDWENDLRAGVLLTAAQQYVRALQGKTSFDDPDRIFEDSSHRTSRYLEHACSSSSMPTRVRSSYAQFLVPILYLFGHIDEAIATGERDLLPHIAGYMSIRATVQSCMYMSLAYIARARSLPDADTSDDNTFAENTLAKLRASASESDVNLGAWIHLLHASLLERSGSNGDCVTAYEAALDHAELNGFMFETAMISEHYAEFLIRVGANRLARNTFRDSIAAYKRISHLGKAEHIALKHEWLLTGTTGLNTRTAGTQTFETGRASFHQDSRFDDQSTVDDFGQKTPVGPVGAKNPVNPSIGPLGSKPDLQNMGLDVVDISNILLSIQILASTLEIDELLSRMANIMLSSAGAEMAAIIVRDGADGTGGWKVATICDAAGHSHAANQPLEKIQYFVGRQITLHTLKFKEITYSPNAYEDERFADVTEASSRGSNEGKSVFCMPIMKGEKLLGAVYIENAPYSFTTRNIAVLQSLLSTVSSSLANANLFKRLQIADAKNQEVIVSQRAAVAIARDAQNDANIARAQAEENLRLKEEASKAKSLFLANTSHELRTPLNGVIGMAELLRESELSSEQMGYIDSIRVCADTLLQVINDILDYTKLDAGKLELYSVPLSLRETIDEVIRALQFTNQGKNIETITKLEFDSALVVNTDPIRLHQVLMNLLSNAYKFTAQGTVSITAMLEEETDTEVEVIVSVQDTGIGVDEESKRKLFLPFSQADSSTSRSYGGTGLGLSICKAIIETAMGGKIWLESQKNVGTTVSFRLRLFKVIKGVMPLGKPRDPNPMQVFTPDEADQPLIGFVDLSGIPPDRLRVAIAEDNPVNQKLAIKNIQRLGYPVEAYDDGKQLLDAMIKAAKDGEPFSIVLMDCQMPVMDGYEASRQIRRHLDPAVRDVVIIAMTASAIRGDREKCLEAGMSNYLAKPVKQKMLTQMLDHYIAPSNTKENHNDTIASVSGAEPPTPDERDDEVVLAQSTDGSLPGDNDVEMNDAYIKHAVKVEV